MSRGDAGAELPEAPRVGGELGLQVGGLPGAATIPTQLDPTDPAGTRESDAAELDRTRRQGSAITSLPRGPFQLPLLIIVPPISLLMHSSVSSSCCAGKASSSS